jgi:hypothetical protein
MVVETSRSRLEFRVGRLPARIREQINACPKEGQGVHPWLFKTALMLHGYFSEGEIVEILRAHLTSHRPEREIIDAVENSGKVARGEMPHNRNPWPNVDYEMVHDIVVRCPVRLEDLRTISPEDLRTEGPRSEEILDALYPRNPLLCVGRSVQGFWTRPREFWRGKESGFSFIVPNPMTKKRGLKKDETGSARCLDNTGPRRFVVIEFDIADGGEWAPSLAEWQSNGITIDDVSVALLVALGTTGLPRLPLALAVHSGGKSVHGWYPCGGLTEDQLKAFMCRAIRLGADKATWTRCQFVRMPGGMRDNGNRQRVHYFAPGVLRIEGGAK